MLRAFCSPKHCGEKARTCATANCSMGGVRTDLEGHTSLAGLYAAGEVASTGVHGANRLASNSLLEGLVFGARAGKKMRDELRVPAKGISVLPPAAYSNGPVSVPVDASINEIQELMWKQVGIVRTGSALKQAITRLQEMAAQVSR